MATRPTTADMVTANLFPFKHGRYALKALRGSGWGGRADGATPVPPPECL